MKKEIVLASVLSMTLALSACSGGASTSETTEPTDSPFSDTTPVQSTGAVEEHVFETTVDIFVNALDKNLKNSGAPSPASITPEISEKEAGTFLAGSYYAYAIDDGINLYIMDSSSSGKVQFVQVIANVSKLTKESSNTLGRYDSTLVAMFEPDKDTLNSVDKSLGIASADLFEDYMGLADGTIASYMYTISDGIAFLSISPL